jgi:O-antigen/teichoic acid export membrane protein
VYLILARLLVPEDFGVVAMALIVVNFSQVFWDAGLEKALIQTSALPEQAAHVVFWTNAFLGLVIFVLLFLAAPRLADFFHSPASLAVVRVLGLQVVIASLASVQQALLVREFGFRELFRVRLATVIVSGGFSIPLALFGYGVWALVAGSLSGSLVNLILLWRQSPWRPCLSFDWHLARNLYGFGLWVVLEGLGAWFFTWGDNLLVGKFLGAHALGVYSVGWGVANLLFSLVLNPVFPVLYPTFSRLRDNVPVLTETFHRANQVVIALALPLGTLLLLAGPLMVSVFLGDKWQGLGLILALVGFMHGMAWLVGINPELYRAMGRPDLNIKIMLATILYYLPAYLLAAPWGLVAFTCVRLGLDLTSIPVHVYFGVRMLRVSPFYLWRYGRPIILATLAMAGVLVILKSLFMVNQTLIWLTILMGVGVLVYGVALWRLDRPFVAEMTRLIKTAVLT